MFENAINIFSWTAFAAVSKSQKEEQELLGEQAFVIQPVERLVVFRMQYNNIERDPML